MEVTFFTGYTPSYREAAERLVADAAKVGMRVEAIPHDDAGEWVLNTKQKPSWILDFLETRSCDAAMWIDADARIRRAPTADEMSALESALSDHDLALATKRPPSQRRYYTGSVLLSRNREAMLFVKVWRHYSSLDEGLVGSDEWAFEVARRYAESELGASIGFLSRVWSWLPKHEKSNPNDTPIVEHGLSGNASEYSKRVKEEGRYDEWRRTL